MNNIQHTNMEQVTMNNKYWLVTLIGFKQFFRTKRNN